MTVPELLETAVFMANLTGYAAVSTLASPLTLKLVCHVLEARGRSRCLKQWRNVKQVSSCCFGTDYYFLGLFACYSLSEQEEIHLMTYAR